MISASRNGMPDVPCLIGCTSRRMILVVKHDLEAISKVCEDGFGHALILHDPADGGNARMVVGCNAQISERAYQDRISRFVRRRVEAVDGHAPEKPARTRDFKPVVEDLEPDGQMPRERPAVAMGEGVEQGFANGIQRILRQVDAHARGRIDLDAVSHVARDEGDGTAEHLLDRPFDSLAVDDPDAFGIEVVDDRARNDGREDAELR